MAFPAGINPNQPYLLVNPPLVAPSVPPPQPGNTGSWCYPSQSPFWAGAAANQTTPPPQFYMADQTYVAQPAATTTVAVGQPNPAPQMYVAEQAYVAQPAFIATPAPAPVQQQQQPQVQYYVNGSMGPRVYYYT
ncbi:hypothetical protein M434DRAFT_394105 [Hypoxylon sp. CO27-5]|nr:hypothetical protein M434DRAFT_394105 [Hypoxylon sp. CO27-5]